MKTLVRELGTRAKSCGYRISKMLRRGVGQSLAMRATRPPTDSPSLTVEVPLSRFFFVLPEPVSLPDGFRHTETVSDAPDGEKAHDDPIVSLIFHRIENPFGRSAGAADAIDQVIRRTPGLPHSALRPRVDGLPGFRVSYTVVEAVTPSLSPDPIPDEGLPSAAGWSARGDAFNRCLRLVSDIIRAYRHATEAPYGLPSYERVALPVLRFAARGVRETFDGDVRAERYRPTEEWAGPQLMMLDHLNLGDAGVGPDFSEEIGIRTFAWLSEIRRGNPVHIWRERFLEARRAHELLGEYAQAVILANTSSEVLLDVILAMLMWEEGVPAEQAAQAYDEGKLLRRITRELAPRLKGNWSTAQAGAVSEWFERTYSLRHRVVHSGYMPSHAQAEQSLSSSAELQRFVMDRVADRRTAYPRSALMTIGEDGLRNRQMWSGQIRSFAEQVAPQEENWADSYAAYHQALIGKTV